MTTPRPTTIALLAVAATTASAWAQPQTKPSKPAPKQPAAKAPTQPAAPASTTSTAPTPAPGQATAVPLSETPFRINSVGLSMHLPVGAVAQTSGTGDQSSAQIIAQDSSYLIEIRTPRSKNEQQTTDAVAKEVLKQLLASVGVIDRKVEKDGTINEKVVSTEGTIVEPIKAFLLPTESPLESRPGSRFYVRLPRGKGEAAVIRGYTVFQVSPGRFVTFDLATPEPNFAAAKTVYETVVATARFADPAALSASRGIAVQTGVEFLSKLSAADLEAACAAANDQWYRIYKPSTSGADGDAQEVAHQHITARRAQRGAMDPTRPESKWTAADRDQGYLVRIDARLLQDNKVIDSVGTYFMTLDRREEAWNLQMVIKDPAYRKPATWSEIGGRIGTSMTVKTEGSGESAVAAPTVPDQGYINQVEAYLLPQLLIRGAQADATGHAGEFGFYSYLSQQNKVCLRRETLAQPQDRAGAWLLTTKLNEDQDPQVSIYNERGQLVKTTLPNGNIRIPITPQRLMDIWTSKSLPTGPLFDQDRKAPAAPPRK